MHGFLQYWLLLLLDDMFFAAIPAVLAYNFIVFGNKQVVQDMDAYAYDLHVKIMNNKE